jgi:hypothetical protein
LNTSVSLFKLIFVTLVCESNLKMNLLREQIFHRLIEMAHPPTDYRYECQNVCQKRAELRQDNASNGLRINPLLLNGMQNLLSKKRIGVNVIFVTNSQ